MMAVSYGPATLHSWPKKETCLMHYVLVKVTQKTKEKNFW